MPFGNLKKMRNSSKSVDHYVKTLLQESVENDNNTPSLLKMLMEANSDHKLSKSAMRDNAIIFIVAGHETTATSLLYVLYNMSIHQDCQDKLREEINRVFPKTVNPEGVKELHYTSNVINESLRLYPPVGFLSRSTKESELKLGDYVIPPNSSFSILVYGLHRDPDVWGEDAENYKPERFDHLTKEQLQSFMPFGSGPRICIGNTFSLFEQKIFLAKLFRKYKVSLHPSSKLVITNLLFAPKSDLLRFTFEKLE